jgi:hypothetical protein
VTLAAESPDDSDRSAALDGWVAAFDRELEQGLGFAACVAAITAHGCFDVRATVERWVLANPSDGAAAPAAQPLPEAPDPPRLELVVAADGAAGGENDAIHTPAPDGECAPLRAVEGSSPDIAYFHSLLRGGIERAQLDAAFPGFRLVIDEAVDQFEAEAPILSDVPAAPSRADLNDEIRGIRKDLQGSPPTGRRRWRSRD